MKRFSIYLFFFVLPGIAFSQQTISGSITHDGLSRTYILYVPENYSGSNPVPLIFNFHGRSMSASSQMRTGDFRPIADTAGFIIVHPQGTRLDGQSHWNVGGFTAGSTVDDVGFTAALLDAISAEYNIDPKRIFSTGYSNGAYMSFLLACSLSEKIAAIAAVGGSMTPESSNNFNPKHPTPILQIHGTADTSVPYEGNDWSESIDDLLQRWVSYNHCSPGAEISAIPDNNSTDGSTVEHIVYSQGDNNVNTEHFKVIGGEHDWPGSTGNMDINASLEIWKFFSRYDINGSIGASGTNYMIDDTKHLKIYPNPTQSYITIELKTNIREEYKWTTLTGKPISSGVLNSNHPRIELNHLPPGMYLLQIGSSNYKILKTGGQ